jgi:DNA-binding NarL/FixJ family response regulator
MPLLDGMEVSQKLRQIGCTAKIVSLTLHHHLVVIRAPPAAKAMGYVFKSYITRGLELAVRETVTVRMVIRPSFSFSE